MTRNVLLVASLCLSPIALAKLSVPSASLLEQDASQFLNLLGMRLGRVKRVMHDVFAPGLIDVGTGVFDNPVTFALRRSAAPHGSDRVRVYLRRDRNGLRVADELVIRTHVVDAARRPDESASKLGIGVVAKQTENRAGALDHPPCSPQHA